MYRKLRRSCPPLLEETPAPVATTGGVGPRADAPAPKYRTGSITDFLPVLSSTAETVAPPVLEAKDDEPNFPDVIFLANDPDIYTDLQVIAEEKPVVLPTPTVPEPPKPQEFVWSASAPLPPAPPKIVLEEVTLEPPTPHEEHEAEPEPMPVRRRSYQEDDEEEPVPRRKKRGRMALLIFGLLFVLAGLGGGGYLLQKHLAGQPARLFAQAKKEYELHNYDPARKLFQELVTKHPDFPQMTEAKFFLELSSFRLAVFSVTVASDPTPAHQKLHQFLAFAAEPTMQPLATNFKPDIWDTVKKLGEDTLKKSSDVFNLDNPDESEQWVNQAAELEPIERQFRPAEMGTQREQIFVDLESQRTKIQKARERLVFLAWAKEQLLDPDDGPIVAVRDEAQKNGLAQRYRSPGTY